MDVMLSQMRSAFQLGFFTNFSCLSKAHPSFCGPHTHHAHAEVRVHKSSFLSYTCGEMKEGNRSKFRPGGLKRRLECKFAHELRVWGGEKVSMNPRPLGL